MAVRGQTVYRCVYEGKDGWKAPVEASIEYGRYFENLFKNIGVVRKGFPEPVDYAQVANRSGFNFHNTMIELLVHFGAIGAALYEQHCQACHGVAMQNPLPGVASLVGVTDRLSEDVIVAAVTGGKGLMRPISVLNNVQMTALLGYLANPSGRV